MTCSIGDHYLSRSDDDDDVNEGRLHLLCGASPSCNPHQRRSAK